MRGASYAASERFIGEEQIAEHHKISGISVTPPLPPDESDTAAVRDRRLAYG